jgi:hypothetical protein
LRHVNRFGASAAVRQTKYALRVANPRAADRPAGGWQHEGRVVINP